MSVLLIITDALVKAMGIFLTCLLLIKIVVFLRGEK